MWFKEITEKAEDFLNKMDKSAATALQNGSPKKNKKQEIDFPLEETPEAPRPSIIALGFSHQQPNSIQPTDETEETEIFPNVSLQQKESPFLDLNSFEASLLEETKTPLKPAKLLLSEPRKNLNKTNKATPKENELVKKALADVETPKISNDESEAKLQSVLRQLDEQSENYKKLLDDYTHSSRLSTQTQASLKEKIEELEAGLTREQESATAYKSSYLKQQSRLEEEKTSLTQSLHELQQKVNSEKSLNRELNNQLKLTQVNLSSAMEELEDYKHKAKSVLHSKEKLISTLQTLSHPEGLQETNDQLELSQKQCVFFQNELETSVATCVALREEIKLLESQQQQELISLQQELWARDQDLSAEKTQREKLEFELSQQNQSIQYYQDDYAVMKTKLQLQIQDREMEIDKLRKQLRTKSLNSSSQEELETRLRTLTDALINKQTLVESLLTEKSSLRLQLDMVKKKHQELSTTIRIPESNSPKQKTPETFNGNIVTSRVKRAYSGIDKLNFKLGVFLRRYPTARLLMLLYMLLLHTWVLVVLLTYSPETHFE